MASLTGKVVPGKLDTVYSRTAIPLGTRAFGTDGNEYIFLQGVASTAQYSWVTYDEEYQTTLLAANAVGPVAVAQAALVANKFGWYGICGTFTGATTEPITVDTTQYGRSTADGLMQHAPASGDVAYGVVARSALSHGSGCLTSIFQIVYPFVDDLTASH